MDFALSRKYSINACEMGLGKTRIALIAAKEAGHPVAVFGPPFLRSSWEAEADLLGVKFDYFSYTAIHKLSSVTFSEYGFWIADECHYLKSPEARRTHAFYALLKSCLPEYFLALSGTPIKNRVPDIWTLLGFCSLSPEKSNGVKLEGTFARYHGFSRYFCHLEVLRLRGKNLQRYGSLRDDRLPELKGLLKDKFIKFRVEDVLKDLPELVRKEVPMVLTDEAPGLKEAFEAYSLGRKADISAKVLNATLKSSLTIEYAKNLRDEGSGPLLIFTDHRDSARRIHEGLPGSILVTGQTDPAFRGLEVVKFQSGKVPFLVATIGSLSVGVTLTAAKHVIFNDLSWVPSDNAQAEKRIHRIGQKSVTFSHYITASPTDKYIAKTLSDKLDSINKVVG